MTRPRRAKQLWWRMPPLEFAMPLTYEDERWLMFLFGIGFGASALYLLAWMFEWLT